MIDKIKENIKLISTLIGITAFVFTCVGFILGEMMAHSAINQTLKHQKELFIEMNEMVDSHTLWIMNLKPQPVPTLAGGTQ